MRAAVQDWLQRRRATRSVASRLTAAGVDGRLLSASPAQDGTTVAATSAGLVVLGKLGAGATPTAEVVAWHLIDRAGWETPRLSLDLTDGPAREFVLADPGSVPRDVRTRVEQSIAWTAHHRLSRKGTGVRVVARRPTGGGELVWRLVADAGTDLSEPDLLVEAERHLAAARAGVD